MDSGCDRALLSEIGCVSAQIPLIARGARILLVRANPVRGIEVKRESLKLSGVNDAAYRSQNAHPDVLEALALLEVARAKVEMVKKLDRGEDAAAAGVLQAQSAVLAAAPASPKIRKEIIALEELQRELSEDRAVTRKRASSQVYEKQRGY